MPTIFPVMTAPTTLHDDGRSRTVEPTSEPAPALDEGDRGSTAGAKWHPGLRMLLTLVVLVPMLSTGVLIASSATSAWNSRQHAQAVARDATQLKTVAAARAEMNSLEVPLSAVSYAVQIGISETELDKLLRPAVPYGVQLSQGTAAIANFPTFSSTRTLRGDVTKLKTMIPEVAANRISFTDVHTFLTQMASAIDSVWYRDYNKLQTAVALWQPPGTFEVHASALRQAYAAFLAGGHEVEGAIFVLEGIGPPDAKQELIQSAGEFQTATSQFAGHLSVQAHMAWRHIKTNPADQQFAGIITQGVNVALNGSKPPFADNLAFAGSSMIAGLRYLSDLDRLVTSASQDLNHSALVHASQATHRLMDELLFLAVLAVICLASVAFAGRMLTRPLKRLAYAARQVHSGNLALEAMPDKGPREVVTTTAAFNDMASTLKAVEAKAVALAAEDLSNPELLAPLPGRTGHALQASVDLLATRIRERELQRQLLHEAATHDALTGLLNRAAVLEFLSHDVTRRREMGETVGVLFIDLDGLKPLNDTYGHEVGDSAIFQTAMTLVQVTDQCDVVGRLGGDEFLVVLCHEHSCDGTAVVERIQNAVAQCRIPARDMLVPLEASVGVALAQCDPDTDPMHLVRQADEAMYEAKKAARAVRERTNLTFS